MYSPNRQRTFDDEVTPRSDAHRKLAQFANYGQIDDGASITQRSNGEQFFAPMQQNMVAPLASAAFQTATESHELAYYMQRCHDLEEKLKEWETDRRQVNQERMQEGYEVERLRSDNEHLRERVDQAEKTWRRIEKKYEDVRQELEN